MLPDTPQLVTVLFGVDGVAAALESGSTAVDMSSISPLATRAFAARVNALGCEYLDAPVFGGELGTKGATLSITVGGSRESFDTVRPLFELMGRNITLFGGNGDGQSAKVTDQIVVALNTEAVVEA